MEGGVRKRGNTWYYYFEAGKVNGKRKKIERKGGPTKKAAQEALRNALNEFNSTGEFEVESSMSFSDFLDYWVKDYVQVNCKYNTKRKYESLIKNLIKPTLGAYKIKQLRYSMLQEFLNDKCKKGYSKSTLSGLKSIIKGSLSKAVSTYRLLRNNPAENIKVARFDNIKKEINVLSISDFNKIINRFSKGNDVYIPLQIAFNTGMREGEVCGLTWDCVDLDRKTIKVEKTLIFKTGEGYKFGTPKTKSSIRVISIGDTLVNILIDHKKWQQKNKLEYGEYYIDTDLVCTKENGSGVTQCQIKYAARIINKELNIKFNFHALRHTHATLLMESGANIKDIQERLGHSKISTTLDTYSHVTEKIKNDTVNIFEKLISNN